jgi:proteasome alpha subunit
MVQEQQSYDQAITVYSPEGRMYQVEYAREAVKKGTITVGVTYDGGVVLIVHRRIHSPLVEESFIQKLFKVDDLIGCSISGLVADARILTDWARQEAQYHKITYGERMDVDTLVKRICSIKRAYTQYGGVRPFGISMQIGGMDREGAHLYETDPGGAFRKISAGALGLGREQAEEMLEDKYRDGMSYEEAVDLGLRSLMASLEESATPSIEMATITLEDGFKLVPPDEISRLVSSIPRPKAEKKGAGAPKKEKEKETPKKGAKAGKKGAKAGKKGGKSAGKGKKGSKKGKK